LHGGGREKGRWEKWARPPTALTRDVSAKERGERKGKRGEKGKRGGGGGGFSGRTFFQNSAWGGKKRKGEERKRERKGQQVSVREITFVFEGSNRGEDGEKKTHKGKKKKKSGLAKSFPSTLLKSPPPRTGGKREKKRERKKGKGKGKRSPIPKKRGKKGKGEFRGKFHHHLKPPLPFARRGKEGRK